MTKEQASHEEARQQRLSLTWHGTNEGPTPQELLGGDTPVQGAKPGLKIKLPKKPTIEPAEDVTVEVAEPALIMGDGVAADALINKAELTSSQALRPDMEMAVSVDDDDHLEGAATNLLAITPAGVNEEFMEAATQESPETAVKEDTIEVNTTPLRAEDLMAEPTQKVAVIASDAAAEDEEEKPVPRLKLTRPASSAKPALTLVDDEVTETCRLKARPAAELSVNNTCKLKPDTQQMVAGGTLGERLSSARELNQLTVFEVAEKTRISSEYISALEQENFDSLPLASIYIKSYLKTLARCYGIDADELISEYEERTGAAKPAQVAVGASIDSQAEEEGDNDGNMLKRISWLVATAAALVFAILCTGYAVNKYRSPDITAEQLQIISDDSLEAMVGRKHFTFQELSIPSDQHASTR